MRTAILTLALIALCLPSVAVGKATTDPNTPRAVAAAADDELQPDSRLARRINIRQLARPIREVIAELSKQSGIVIKSGYNNQDWQVRDRKMSIFAKDVPLAQIMNSIAHVMKFKWSRKGKDGEWEYRLYMDRRTLLEAEAQRSRAQAKQEADQARRRQKSMDLFCGLSKMSPEEKEKLKSENPFLYAVSDIGWGDALGDFLREAPAAREALATGQTIQLDGSSLSPAARTGLNRAMNAEIELEARFSGGKSSRMPLPDNLDSSEVTIYINRNLDILPEELKGNGMFLGEIRYDHSGGSVSTPFLNPDSDIIKFVGKLMLECKQQNRPIDEVIAEHATEMVAVAGKETKSINHGEPEPAHPDDPELDAKIDMKPESSYLPNIEQELSEASKLCVVSDYFQGMSALGRIEAGTGSSPLNGEMELRAALEKISESYYYNWDKQASVIELRDRNWFKKRAAQIPDAWLEKWKNELKKTGTIDIDNLAQIAHLTQEQFSANVMFDEDLALTGLMGSVYSSREFLRFYGNLSSDQRAMLMTDLGLDAAALSSDQYEQYAKFLDTKGSMRLAAGERAYIKGTRREAGRAFVYDFALAKGDGSSSGWTVVTPAAETRPARQVDEPKPMDAKPSTEPAPAPAENPVAS